MFSHNTNTQSGSSLIAMAIMIIVLGTMITGFLFIYQNQELIQKDQETIRKNQVISMAIKDYLMRYGRLPCPAPINVQRDSPFFGIEDPVQVCTSPNYYSAFLLSRGIVTTQPIPQCPTAAPNCRPGAVRSPIKIGTIPTRSLNINDDYMVDGYGHRYVYAVTETLATDVINPNADFGSIDIIDEDGLTLPAQRGHVKYIFFSPGRDPRGAYTSGGGMVQPCQINTVAGQNCDWQQAGALPANRHRATFVSSFFKNYD